MGLPLLFVMLGGILAAFAAAPLLIHLINMMRHRRVKWAAMDFLLQSYRRQRNWIFIKQLLLLLTRMAAMILVALLLFTVIHFLLSDIMKNMRPNDPTFRGVFGSATTHHYVLLDDSFSMNDRSAVGQTVFEQARVAIEKLADDASIEPNQRFTLIRFSRANSFRADDEQPPAPSPEITPVSNQDAAAIGEEPGEEADPERSAMDSIVDINGRWMDGDFLDDLKQTMRRRAKVTELSVGPVGALEVVKRLVSPNEDNVVYIFSDFREPEWGNPTRIKDVLEEIKPLTAEVRLVSCAKVVRGNLGIVGISPASETRAAGVPLFIDVEVKNFGPESVRRVQLKLRSFFYDPDDDAQGNPAEIKADDEELPVVLIEEIPPGDTVTRRVQVFFREGGKHVVEAQLPDDAIATDNRRRCVVDFPDGEPVLVIDGNAEQRNFYYLASAFEPGVRANTGVRPEVQTSAFLRDADIETLRGFRAIYLLDVERLDDSAINNLKKFVEAGGGVAFFAGDNINFDHYNEKLYEEGEGLFPVPLERSVGWLDPEIVGNTPDLEVDEKHPVFRAFAGDGGILLRLVTIERHLKVEKEWKPTADSGVEVVATLRGGAPLVVEKSFGEGRVMAFLTSAAPDWNNWARGPTFPVVVLELQSRLGAPLRTTQEHTVGATLDVQLEIDKYVKDLMFTVPGELEGQRSTFERLASRPAEDSPIMVASIGRTTGAVGGETERSGVYEAWMTTTKATPEVRRFAVNVDAAEGATEIVSEAALAQPLASIDTLVFVSFDGTTASSSESRGPNLTHWVLIALIVVLMGEQVLAYFAGYHTKIVRGGAQ